MLEFVGRCQNTSPLTGDLEKWIPNVIDDFEECYTSVKELKCRYVGNSKKINIRISSGLKTCLLTAGTTYKIFMEAELFFKDEHRKWLLETESAVPKDAAIIAGMMEKNLE